MARCLLDMPRSADRVGRVARPRPIAMLQDISLAGKLAALASRVNRNIPLNSDPTHFHEEKSEIAGALSAIADELRR